MNLIKYLVSFLQEIIWNDTKKKSNYDSNNWHKKLQLSAIHDKNNLKDSKDDLISIYIIYMISFLKNITKFKMSIKRGHSYFKKTCTIYTNNNWQLHYQPVLRICIPDNDEKNKKLLFSSYFLL